MHLNWNKRVLASSFAVLSMATSLYAIPRDPCEPVCEPICCEAPIPGPFAFAYPMDLGLNCPRDFYVHIDGLAFQAKQDGMDFAIEDSTTNGTVPVPPMDGRVFGFSGDGCSSWGYNPGMRFGLGFYLDHDAWNIDLDWTWLHISEYRRAHADNNALLIPLWLLGSDDTNPGLYGTHANAKWNGCYNTFDISLGKPYHVSRYLILNPYFGLRGAWIDQHYSVHYFGASTEFESIHHGRKNDFRGIGSRVGVNSDWIIGKGWWLFSNVSASLLSGKFEIHQQLHLPPATGGDGFDLHADYFQNVPNMEIALGIAWSRYFDCCRYRLGLRAAYEFIEWWDQLNMRRFYSGAPGYASDVVSRGNLTLNGFSLRFQIDL